MRKFGSAAMWNNRNATQPKAIPGAPTEIPATAIILTEEAGVAQSELTPQFLAGPNANAMVMTTAKDYGTLHAAGRPTRT